MFRPANWPSSGATNVVVVEVSRQLDVLHPTRYYSNNHPAQTVQRHAYAKIMHPQTIAYKNKTLVGMDKESTCFTETRNTTVL
jgi:hypothetical protein